MLRPSLLFVNSALGSGEAYILFDIMYMVGARGDGGGK